jgi:Co/Zn/Cd efflux system component
MDRCCGPVEVKSQKFRRVVWTALVLNFGMFLYEFGASFLADSQSLKADSLDFLGDAANYGVSLFVIGLAIQTRAKASLIKGLTMGAFGIWVLFQTVYNAIHGASPNAEVMGFVGLLALIVNAIVAILLYQFRDGDSNMQSVWLCTRNDVIGNIAVLGAAAGVAYLNSMLPDLIVATFMAYLSVSASVKIIRLALVEMRTPVPVKACSSKVSL